MEGLVLLASRQSQWRELSYRRALTNDQAYLRDMATYRPDVAHDILLRYAFMLFMRNYTLGKRVASEASHILTFFAQSRDYLFYLQSFFY